MALRGKKICFTGTLTMKRAEMVTAATNAGANVVSSISAMTNVLVAGPGAGSKMAKALALGVKVMNEAEFRKAAGVGGTKRAASPAPVAMKAPKAAPDPAGRSAAMKAAAAAAA